MSRTLTDTEDGRKKLQRALADHGFQPGPIDGVLGQQTARAIINARIAYKLSHQDQALVDIDLERELSLLTVQDPVVVGAAAMKGIDLLSLLKLIGLAQSLVKGTANMDGTKPWYTSQTVWASALAILGTVLSFFHVNFGAADQATVVDSALQIVTAVSSLWAIISRLRATKMIS